MNKLAVIFANGWADAVGQAVDDGIISHAVAFRLATDAADFAREAAKEEGVLDELEAVANNEIAVNGWEDDGGCGCGASLDELEDSVVV